MACQLAGDTLFGLLYIKLAVRTGLIMRIRYFQCLPGIGQAILIKPDLLIQITLLPVQRRGCTNKR